MKILLATETYHPDTNGAAYFTYRLATGLAQRGHQVSVFTPARRFKTSVDQEDGVRVAHIRSVPTILNKLYRTAPFADRIIFELMQKEAPDLIHIQSHFFVGTSVFKAAQRLGLPVIGTNHFMPDNLVHYLYLPPLLGRALKRFMWHQCVRLFSKFNLVTTPTQTAADLLKRFGFKKEIIVISNGIDLKIFNNKNNGSYLRERYHLGDQPIILYVGRLEEEKRVMVLIRALALVLKEMPAQLVLVGVGNDESRLKNLAQELGVRKQITLTGFIPDADLPNLYSLVQVFAIASVAELQSIATLEAMASGLPVVAARSNALPELVKEGINGYLFRPDDEIELAQELIKILGDQTQRRAMSEKSLELVKNHSFDKTLDRFEELYQLLLTQKRNQ